MIVCITGLAGSGKTTLANSLVQHFQKTKLNFLHINSDFVAKRIFLKKYGSLIEQDFDYSADELDTIYAAMNEIIQKVLEANKRSIILTDGMYRKNSQRILLEVIAKKLNVPFHLIKVEIDEKKAKSRLAIRLKESGLGGWVDVSEYEEICNAHFYSIQNSGSFENFKRKITLLVNRSFSTDKIILRD